VRKGGYVILDCKGTPAAVLIANGSEVATLVEGSEKLMKKGYRVRIVSMPSEGLFRDQSNIYQNSVLPKGVLRFGLTSGLPSTLQGIVGDNGAVFGLQSFGHSAPYNVLDEKFGFTGDNIYRQVMKLLS